MSKAEEAALKAYPEDWEAGYFDDPDEVTDDNTEAREYFQQGYEQAEKDIWAAIEKYLSKRDTGDFATVGWILKHLNEYKKAIMEEE